MRWITFIFLLYFAAAFQAAALFGFPSSTTMYPSPRIEYVTLLIVFYCFYADENQAPLVGLAGGLAVDLIARDAVLGTHTVSLGLVALAIVKVRLSIFREQAISKIIVTVLAVLVYAAIVGFMNSLGNAPAGSGFLRFLRLMAANALYTGLVAPVFFWLLLRLRAVLGFGAHGPRMR